MTDYDINLPYDKALPGTTISPSPPRSGMPWARRRATMPTDATIAGKPVEWWEGLMDQFANTHMRSTFRGLYVAPSPIDERWGIAHPSYIFGDDSRWPGTLVSGPRGEEDGYARW